MMTPFDVQTKEFSKALNGYNRSEVEDFLTKVSDMFESLMRESDYFKTQISTSDKKLAEYQSQENSLKDALVGAQVTSKEIIGKAENQAMEILKMAEAESEKILEGVKSDYINIENATKLLKRDYLDFQTKYREVLNEQIIILDKVEVSEID